MRHWNPLSWTRRSAESSPRRDEALRSMDERDRISRRKYVSTFDRACGLALDTRFRPVDGQPDSKACCGGWESRTTGRVPKPLQWDDGGDALTSDNLQITYKRVLFS